MSTHPVDLESLRGHTPARSRSDLSALEDADLQEKFSAAIMGAMMYGAGNTNPPPAGHWLEQFWQLGRSGITPHLLAELTSRRARDAKVAELVEAAESMLDHGYKHVDRRIRLRAALAAFKDPTP